MFFRGQTVGKYKILSPLGSGGFGTVYLAQDTWLDKKVAIKVPHRQQNLDFGELLHEPRLLGSLSHPNIVSVLTAEKQEGLFFIVMEYVAGETLETVIMREGAVELTRALDFAVQIANAVDYAHRQNVIHRDLRPGNVLISEQGLVKVADFGTSRVLEIAAHGTTVIGSPPYMAPEQFHGKAVFASDLYSLGITMYQMLTGVLPYETPSPAELARLMTGELVSPPRVRNPKLPKAVNEIVMKALAPDIGNRYQRAADLLADIMALGRDAGSRRPSRTPAAESPAARRPRRTCRRSTAGSALARPHRPGSAGTAASRCTPARTSARSAGRISRLRDCRLTGYRAHRLRATGYASSRACAIIPRTNRANVTVTSRKEHVMSFGTGKIWMNGSLVDWADAKIHIASHVIHYGTGVFEGARCYSTPKGSACFRLDSHVIRLLDSAKIYRMDSPLDKAGWENAILDTIRENEAKACYIRPLMYRGYNQLGVNPLPCPVDAAVLVWEWGAYLGPDALDKGVDVRVSSWNRTAPNTFPAAAKATANYANSVLIKMEAMLDGYAEGIALDVSGYVSRGVAARTCSWCGTTSS